MWNRLKRKRREILETDHVCAAHFSDPVLVARLKKGEAGQCSLCGKTRPGMQVSEIAEAADPIVREHFAPGEEEKVFDGVDDDSGRWEQQGEDLVDVLSEVFGETDEEIIDAVAKSLQDRDLQQSADGGGGFFDGGVLYQETSADVGAHFERWQSVQRDLQHHHRFFSQEAKRFFDWLFVDLESLEIVGRGRRDVRGAVRDLGIGTTVFRGRQCDSDEDLADIARSPLKHLRAPPPARAPAGRMNAEGVPVFYGALEAETCIAELRPPLGGRVAVGKFTLCRDVRLLDFRALERAYPVAEKLSYFQEDFSQIVSKSKFIRKLHRLIRLPVLPARERDYLITQAMAEYLNHVRDPAFDGLIFESAQREEGANVVLFRPAIDSGPRQRRPLFKLAEEGWTLHSIRRIAYSDTELDCHLYRNGKVIVTDPTAGPDD